MYNDQPPPPGKTSFDLGHSKGVLAADNSTGFWLVHSVPRFPPYLEDGAYGYPSTGHRYGQSFLCITMGAMEINKAGKQLLYNEVAVYSSRIHKKLRYFNDFKKKKY